MSRDQQRWPVLARRAAGRGQDLAQVFAVSRAVVLRWWAQAPAWEAERIWPDRLSRLTDHPAAAGRWGEAGWDSAVRDAVTLPEVITVAVALTDPACARMVRSDHAGTRPDGWGPGGRLSITSASVRSGPDSARS
ncbi:hypothetical protein [Streptomyces sp. NPDC099088]|uniref:hypothetical protein n=1 Tax=Streptomyces sp. NPDC099088 TaxID=3366101 RepID=UPI00380585B6